MDAPPQSLPAAACHPSAGAEPTPAEPAYWVTRILRQRYTTHTRPGSENELFARFEHGGEWMYFPLHTHLPEKAAGRACEIFRELTSDGWEAVRQRHVRQIVWAIIWFTEPLACTYATLFTVLDQEHGPAKRRSAAKKKIPVVIVEPEPGVLRGLKENVNRMDGYACVLTAASARELLQAEISACTPRLVLFNQQKLDLSTEAFQHQLQVRWPGVVAVPFSIFGHSDALFMTVTGMDRGYFLRRRPPAQILEPTADLWAAKTGAPEPPRAHFQRYFQKLIFAESPLNTLSQREMEMMRYLSAGHTDKTIASLLGISAWTVHSHMKSIFGKLGVHTRAEAVTRFLQR